MSVGSHPGLLRTFDPVTGDCVYLPVTREQLQKSAFHDGRLQVSGTRRVPADQASSLAESARDVRVSYIFHTAFCGSTLLARSFDSSGMAISFREPELFMELSNRKRMQGDAGDGHSKDIDRAVRLLSAGMGVTDRAIIKPTNAANNLISDIVRSPSTQAGLLLYSDLRSFLISVIKKGEQCRAFVRNLFNVLVMDSSLLAAINERQRLLFTDLQIAAIVWYLQMRNYMVVLDEDRESRLRTLDAALFLAEPVRALPAIVEYFEMAGDPDALDRVFGDGVFARDSKDPQQFYDTRVRDEEAARIGELYADALQTIIAWADNLQQQMGLVIPERMPAALELSEG